MGLVFAALGDDSRLDACIEELQELGEAGRLPVGTTAASLTRAYKAFAAEEWARAIELLEPLMDELVRIGSPCGRSPAQGERVSAMSAGASITEEP